MIIEVLGIEGEQTAALEAALAQALAELGLDGTASVRRVTDPAAIVARGVRRWPGLSVNGTVVCRARADCGRGVRLSGGRRRP